MNKRILLSAVSAAAALLFSGCAAFLPRPPAPVPAYSVPDAPLPEAASASAGRNAVFVVGRVRAAPEAAGKALRATDAASGRTAFFPGGELASSAEDLLSRRLRRSLAAERPRATVFDSALAPRGKKVRVVDAWIDEFRLVREGQAWRFRFAATIYRHAPDGAVESRDIALAVPVESSGAEEPEMTAVTAAIAKALEGVVVFE